MLCGIKGAGNSELITIIVSITYLAWSPFFRHLMKARTFLQHFFLSLFSCNFDDELSPNIHRLLFSYAGIHHHGGENLVFENYQMRRVTLNPYNIHHKEVESPVWTNSTPRSSPTINPAIKQKMVMAISDWWLATTVAKGVDHCQHCFIEIFIPTNNIILKF